MPVDSERQLKAAESLFQCFLRGAHQSSSLLNDTLNELGSKVTVESRDDLAWRLICHFNSGFLVYAIKLFYSRSSEEAAAETTAFFTDYLKTHLIDSVLSEGISNFSRAEQEQGRAQLEEGFLRTANSHWEAYSQDESDPAIKHFSSIVFGELQIPKHVVDYLKITSHLQIIMFQILPVMLKQADEFNQEYWSATLSGEAAMNWNPPRLTQDEISALSEEEKQALLVFEQTVVEAEKLQYEEIVQRFGDNVEGFGKQFSILHKEWNVTRLSLERELRAAQPELSDQYVQCYSQLLDKIVTYKLFQLADYFPSRTR